LISFKSGLIRQKSILEFQFFARSQEDHLQK
jgi:hypothetical protein